MSRKHYKQIAEVLRQARNGTEDKQVIRHIITELSKIFIADNPQFDNGRFEQAVYK